MKLTKGQGKDRSPEKKAGESDGLPSVEELNRIRHNALVAKYLHATRVKVLNRSTRTTDYLSLAVPLLYLPLRFVSKEKPYFSMVEIAWEGLVAVMTALVAARLVYGWDSKLREHERLQEANSDVAETATDAIVRPESPLMEESAFKLLQAKVARIDKADLKSLGLVSDRGLKRAYLLALRETPPYVDDPHCPVCGASPFTFKAGTCPACGNTPVTV